MTDDKVKRIKAPQTLKDKAGTGQVDARKVSAGQKVLEENAETFIDIAQENLAKLKKAVQTAKTENLSKQELIVLINAPLLQLKSSAGMFNYDLVGEMANIMFNFLERVGEVDNDAIAIVEAHHTTLQAIVGNRMEGDGGAAGMQLKRELEGVCKRYFDKRT